MTRAPINSLNSHRTRGRRRGAGLPSTRRPTVPPQQSQLARVGRLGRVQTAKELLGALAIFAVTPPRSSPRRGGAAHRLAQTLSPLRRQQLQQLAPVTISNLERQLEAPRPPVTTRTGPRSRTRSPAPDGRMDRVAVRAAPRATPARPLARARHAAVDRRSAPPRLDNHPASRPTQPRAPCGIASTASTKRPSCS